MRVFARFTAAALAAVTLLSAVPAAATGGVRAELRRHLRDAVAGGSLAVLAEVRAAGRTHRLAEGRIRYGRPQPAQAAGRFRIGSVTKAFTATVVLQLAAEGRLTLADPLARWLPGAVREGERVTLRDLLRHTSGIPDYFPTLLDAAGNPREPLRTWREQELVGLAEKLPRTPVTFSYSNTNYVLLGMVIRAVTGRGYATEITERVIGPAGLTRTSAPDAVPSIKGPHPHAHTVKDGSVTDITALNPTILGAAGGMVSTTADLNRFMRALLGGELLPPAWLAEMKKPLPGGSYGLGLASLRLPCGTFYGQAGGVAGYFAAAFRSEDGRREVGLAATPYTGDPGRALNTLLARTACESGGPSA